MDDMICTMMIQCWSQLQKKENKWKKVIKYKILKKKIKFQ